jgi:hypothetical protein
MAKDKKTIKVTGDSSDARATIGDLKREAKAEFDKMAKDAEKTSKEVSSAFKKMGIRTEKDIKKSTQEARANYEKIKNSGTASSNDIKRAHTRMTAKIKANNREMRTGASRLSNAYAAAKSKIVGISLGVVGALFAVKRAFDFAESGAKLKVQREAFNNFAKSMGANGEKILKTLKDVSRGTVSTSDLIKSAGTALLLGLDPKKIVGLLKIARAAAKITGESVTAQFEDIAKGTGRASKLILDNLGIQFSQAKANEAMAASLDKTVDALTDVEIRQGNLNEVVRAGAVIIQGVGEDYDSQSDSLARLKAKYENAKDAVSIFILKALVPIEKVLLRMRKSQLLLQRGFFEMFPLLAKASDFFGLTSNATATVADATDTLNKEIRDLEGRLERVSRVEKERISTTKNFTKEIEKQGSISKQQKEEQKKLIEDNLRTDLDSIDKRKKAQQILNATIKTAIQTTREELRNLMRDVDEAQAFVNTIEQEIQSGKRGQAQTGFNPVEKLISDLEFAEEDFRKAAQERAKGNFKSARELTLSAIRAAGSVISADKVGFQESGFSPEGLDKAKETAVKMQEAAVIFAQEMEQAAQEKVPAVSKELETLEGQLKAGEATLDGLRIAIKNARDEAREMKGLLSEDTTSTHTQIIKTVHAASEGGPVGLNKGGGLGGYGGGDRIPALLEAGEHVIRKESVRKLGRAAADAFNRGDVNSLIANLLRNQSTQRLQQGGAVKPMGEFDINLNMGGKTFKMSTSKKTGESFRDTFKNMNIIYGKGKIPY